MPVTFKYIDKHIISKFENIIKSINWKKKKWKIKQIPHKANNKEFRITCNGKKSSKIDK